MRNNFYIPLAILFLSVLCMGFQCTREEMEVRFSFVEKINLSPAQKSYKIGDTIWLKYSNPNNSLNDSRTGSSIDADTVSIDFQVSFNSRFNTPVNPAGGFCDFVSSSGLPLHTDFGLYGTGILYLFGCNSNNNYDFTVGVVPKHTGIFSLDLLGAPRNVLACSNRISAFPLSTIEYMFDVADGNKDVYLTIPANQRGSTDPGYVERNIDGKKVYIVKVE